MAVYIDSTWGLLDGYVYACYVFVKHFVLHVKMAVYMVYTCTMHVMYSFYTSKTLNGCLHGAHDGGY